MNNLIQFMPQLAHFFIGFYFAFFGFWNIYHWSPIIKTMIERNIPSPMLILSFAILWESVLGFLIIFGIYIKISAILLIPFTIIAAFIFHPFWKFSGETRRLNFNIFMTNLTISLGSLLLLLSDSIN